MKEDKINKLNIMKIFFKETIRDMKDEREVSCFSFAFSKEAYLFFQRMQEEGIITSNDINNLKELEQYDNQKSVIFVRDHFAFFDYLTKITNQFVKLNYDYLELNQLPSFLGECILRKIWLRMEPTDFNHVEDFLKKQLDFLKDDSLEEYIIPTLIDTYYDYKVIADVTLNETFYEANKCMHLKLVNRKNRYDLGKIHYDILNDGTKKICYVYDIQTNQILTLYYFIKVLKQNGIYNIQIPLTRIDENKKEKFICLINCIIQQYTELGLNSEFILEDNYLDIKLNKSKVKRKKVI